ncbi:MAG: helicase, partial [Lentisphaerae bacterium]|nr:helicase [Lentisphaerota bacterium]
DMLVCMRAWDQAARRRFEPGACAGLGLDAAAARRVGELHAQFCRLARRQGLRVAHAAAPVAALLKCLAAAFPDRVGRRLSPATGRVLLVHARRADLAADSTVRRAELLVAPELQRVEVRRGQVETRLSLASAIDLQWLRDLYPGHLIEKREVFYDRDLRRVVARDNLFFLDLPVHEGRRRPAETEEAAVCLAREVASGRLPLKQWNDRVEQWILRLNSLAGWCPELGLPALDDGQRLPLLEQVCHGAGSAREIRDRPVLPVLQSWLSAPQLQLLLRQAPEQVRLSNGRQVRLTYETGLAPFFNARIQDLYDVRECPRIAMGRVRLRVKILAPNQRPIQITDDLASFWTEGYQRARKELRGRYPKHEWR